MEPAKGGGDALQGRNNTSMEISSKPSMGSKPRSSKFRAQTQEYILRGGNSLRNSCCVEVHSKPSTGSNQADTGILRGGGGGGGGDIFTVRQ